MTNLKHLTESPTGHGSASRAIEAARKRIRLLFALTALALSTSQSTSANPEPDFSLLGEWRITRVVYAPWTTETGEPEKPKTLVGQRVVFKADSVDGPGLLRCNHVVTEKTSYAAENLFQGALPNPSAKAIEALGISQLPLAGVALICSTGLFEFHFVEPDTLLTALDNQILTLSRSGATRASENSPEGRLQRFLELHFSADMGFSLQRMRTQSGWLSIGLDRAITDYFTKPASSDEVPAIDGDPFTDSQRYPTRFSVGKATVSGDRAEIPIRFSDGFSDRVVTYRLLHEADKWQLDDVRFDSDETLSNLLK